MSFNLGINVVEVDGSATPSIQAAPTSVTGFIVHARRGIPGVVRRVTSWTQFVEHFGAHADTAYGAYAVQGFLANGGTVAHVVRVANTTPGTASVASIVSAPGPFRLRDGGTLTVESDLLAADATVTFEASPALLQGDAGPFDLLTDGGADEISFIVDGVTQGPYTFDADDFGGDLSAADAAAVAEVLNREFRGVQVWVDANDARLRVRTDRRGTSASLLAVGEAVAKLGLPAGVAAGGGNVADVEAVSAAEVVGALSPELGGLQLSVDQGRVRIRHPEAGVGHTLRIVGGASSVHTELGFDDGVHAGTDGDLAAAATAATRAFEAAGNPALTVTAAYRGTDDPGAWGRDVSVRVTPNAGDPDRFDLVVRHGRDVVESWEGLGMVSSARAYVEDVLNDENAGSRFVRAAASGDQRPDATAAHPAADDRGFVPLAGGSDGAWPGEEARVAALAEAVARFENVEVQLLLCPETDSPELVNAALAHCETMNDRMFIGHTPATLEAGSVRDGYSLQFQGEKRYGALYFPWIQVARPGGGRRWVPPTGHIAGMYARTDRERGVWKAPAGNAARLNGALDVRYHVNDVDHTDLVKNGSVNAVRFLPGQGIVVDSSRTLSTSTLWLYVNVRLLFNLVKSSLRTGLRWAVQEPNHPDLWNKIRFNSVTPFLMGLWRRGAFGPGGAEDVFTVKVDAENNPPSNIQQGLLTVEVTFYPSRPAETIVITVGQQEGAGSASES